MHTDEGPCSAISAIMEFAAVPVFFFPPDSGCDPCGNDTCEYFESCETCLIDCCAGCGNGACEFYPTSEYPVDLTDAGFGAAELDLLVGDTVVWTNQTDGPVNLACDDFATNQAIAPAESHLHGNGGDYPLARKRRHNSSMERAHLQLRSRRAARNNTRTKTRTRCLRTRFRTRVFVFPQTR